MLQCQYLKKGDAPVFIKENFHAQLSEMYRCKGESTKLPGDRIDEYFTGDFNYTDVEKRAIKVICCRVWVNVIKKNKIVKKHDASTRNQYLKWGLC